MISLFDLVKIAALIALAFVVAKAVLLSSVHRDGVPEDAHRRHDRGQRFVSRADVARAPTMW